MDLASKTPAIIEFGRFRVVPHRRELLADGQPIHLGGRTFDVLMALIDAWRRGPRRCSARQLDGRADRPAFCGAAFYRQHAFGRWAAFGPRWAAAAAPASERHQVRSSAPALALPMPRMRRVISSNNTMVTTHNHGVAAISTTAI
jgi:hypothetical protein